MKTRYLTAEQHAELARLAHTAHMALWAMVHITLKTYPVASKVNRRLERLADFGSLLNQVQFVLGDLFRSEHPEAKRSPYYGLGFQEAIAPTCHGVGPRGCVQAANVTIADVARLLGPRAAQRALELRQLGPSWPPLRPNAAPGRKPTPTT
ncbi:MAG: hypothetical protein NTW86_02440 [Candidatus Sumerlaeota bacterium]|nr:hypothetical protein [Candidatus Sumerlaeota bacterium]